MIRLRLTADILQVHKFLAIRSAEDVVAAADPQQLKAKALDQTAKVGKGNVLQIPPGQPAEELFALPSSFIPKNLSS